jgi:hypothetical protein
MTAPDTRREALPFTAEELPLVVERLAQWASVGNQFTGTVTLEGLRSDVFARLAATLSALLSPVGEADLALKELDWMERVLLACYLPDTPTYAEVRRVAALVRAALTARPASPEPWRCGNCGSTSLHTFDGCAPSAGEPR